MLLIHNIALVLLLSVRDPPFKIRISNDIFVLTIFSLPNHEFLIISIPAIRLLQVGKILTLKYEDIYRLKWILCLIF